MIRVLLADDQSFTLASTRVLILGSMPCDGAWPAEQVAVFERWLATGCTP
jgi:hypothetical protein